MEAVWSDGTHGQIKEEDREHQKIIDREDPQ
jgi:hypothetical protein